MEIPKEIEEILSILSKNDFEAAIVGGAARNLAQDMQVLETNDWDLATNAKPEEVQKLFKKSFYNNIFGTIGIPATDGTIQITTYRSEGSYTDKRHPDKVVWGKSLEKDLARRDFTINAIALRLRSGSSTLHFVQDKPLTIVDPFEGRKDLKQKIIRTVGDSDSRFGEDALRLLRAVRFATSLEFSIEEKTLASIKKNAHLIDNISGERIRDELFKIVESKKGYAGILLLKETGLLTRILSELDVCFNVEQKSPKRHHIYDVGTHCVQSLAHCPSKKTIVRFATLLHDVGKAKVANVTSEGIRTFYNHEVVGGKIVLNIAKRFHFSRKEREKLYKLVRYHQFTVNEAQTDRALRRFIKNVGRENIEDMMDLRVGDRLGGGLQQPEGWRLQLFRKRLKDVTKKPFTVADLKIDGHDVMKTLKLKPGPKVGEILNKLFEEVADDKKKNTKAYLLARLQKFQA